MDGGAATRASPTARTARFGSCVPLALWDRTFEHSDLKSEIKWFLLRSGRCLSVENMAWDEGLLEAASQLGCPVLRTYGWLEPAATFGYFQRFAEVERLTPQGTLIRGPTGGGLVAHDADWTYSVVCPPTDAWYELKAEESYRRVHTWIQEAFARTGIVTDLSGCRRRATPGQSFEGAERFDVLWHRRKLAGAAQRRSRSGLLIQGSIQPLPALDRDEFEQA